MPKKQWLTPSQNVDILKFFRTFFLWSIKHSFLSRISKDVFFLLFLLKKKYEEKVDFFDKNHGLTPLENADFLYFARVSLFRSKKHSLLSRISKNVSFLLCLLTKKTYKNKVEFLQKPSTNPFAKCTFLWLC